MEALNVAWDGWYRPGAIKAREEDNRDRDFVVGCQKTEEGRASPVSRDRWDVP